MKNSKTTKTEYLSPSILEMDAEISGNVLLDSGFSGMNPGSADETDIIDRLTD